MTMKIKMIAFYHGQLNGSVRWFEGEEHEVETRAGKQLVERGYAVQVKTRPKPKPVQKAAK
jgi:hypothetical protein